MGICGRISSHSAVQNARRPQLNLQLHPGHGGYGNQAPPDFVWKPGQVVAWLLYRKTNKGQAGQDLKKLFQVTLRILNADYPPWL